MISISDVSKSEGDVGTTAFTFTVTLSETASDIVFVGYTTNDGTATEASGESRAIDAAHLAIASPLLDIDINGARGVLFNITGGMDLTLYEVNEAADIISKAAHQEANIIFGAVQDPVYEGKVKITVIATGFDGRTPVGTTQQGRMDYNRSMFYQAAPSVNANGAPRQQPAVPPGYSSMPVTPPPMNNIARRPTGPMPAAARPAPPVPVMQEPARQPIGADGAPRCQDTAANPRLRWPRRPGGTVSPIARSASDG